MCKFIPRDSWNFHLSEIAHQLFIEVQSAKYIATKVARDIILTQIFFVIFSTHQQNDRNVKKIEQKKEGYKDATITPRDHFMKRKLGVKGPQDFT